MKEKAGAELEKMNESISNLKERTQQVCWEHYVIQKKIQNAVFFLVRFERYTPFYKFLKYTIFILPYRFLC